MKLCHVLLLGILFWSKSEAAEMKEFEEKAHPLTIQQMLSNVQKEKKEHFDKIMKREAEIEKNLGKLNQWIREIDEKKTKKEEEARKARERKDRLIDEVRREFGFALDPRDERFKEMLAIKEKEQKKALKEQKKKEKEAKLLQKLVESNATNQTEKPAESVVDKKAENPEK
jgi:hypothetical protein